jgi:predicted dehydrogenase
MKHKIERLLIVGLGSIGARHLQLAQKLMPAIKIAILRHKNCKDKPDLDIDVCFTNIDDALKFKPDAAILANPAVFHLDVALQLVEAGIHLFIEKPISDSSIGVNELINSCKKQKTVLMTGYNMRFLPSLKMFREHIIENKIGKIFYVRAEVGQHLAGWRPNIDYRQTVSAQKKLGGGVLLELSHEIDYLQWIFGKIDWINAHVSKQSNLEIDVEDTANVLIGFKAENNTQQLIANLTMDFIRHDTTRQCIAVGEGGTLRWNGIEGNVDYFPADGKDWEVLFVQTIDRNFTYREEMTHFFSCVENDMTPMITGEDGMNVLKVVDAINISSEMGQLVHVENSE